MLPNIHSKLLLIMKLRYPLPVFFATILMVARATVPVGSEEEINQGNFDYDVFGTVRYELSDTVKSILTPMNRILNKKPGICIRRQR